MKGISPSPDCHLIDTKKYVIKSFNKLNLKKESGGIFNDKKNSYISSNKIITTSKTKLVDKQ